jgi:hypothetical protein
MEAAAAANRPLQLLALVSLGASLAAETDVRPLPDIRAQAAHQRTSLTT